jgi:hypothetical protein
VQIEEGVFPEFSQSLLLTTAFEDEDDDEDGYEMRNAKREAPGEKARRRSWKRTGAGSASTGSLRFSGNGM